MNFVAQSLSGSSAMTLAYSLAASVYRAPS
jgi:hypothetical protein